MCSHEASLQCECECVEFDALIGGMPCHRGDICRAEGARVVHLALHLAGRGCRGAEGENSFPFDGFDRRETSVEVLMIVGEEIGGGGRRGRRYCWSRVVACD